MSGQPTPILLVVFLVFLVLAVIEAKGIKRKVVTIGISFLGVATGFLIGYLCGLWASNMALGGDIAAPLGELLGGTAAYYSMKWHKAKVKSQVLPAPEQIKTSDGSTNS